MSLVSPSETNPTLSLLRAESLVLTAVAGDARLEGTADELIQRLDVGPRVFRIALQDLVTGGWIFTTTTRDGRLIIGRERRSHIVSLPGSPERRRPASLWEGLEGSFDA